MIRLWLALLMGLCAAMAQAQSVGFAKFSPLEVHSSQALQDPRPQPVPFSTPLRIVQTAPLALQVELEGGPVWVPRADLLVPDTELYMSASAGFDVEVRPVLRFWRSLGVASEFLSASDVRSASPDLEEIRVKRRLRRLRLPVLTRDWVDVMGRRPVRMAAVLLPLDRAVEAAFDQARGAQQRRIDVQLVIDASPDARPFSAEAADFVYRELGRYQRQSGDQIDISVTLFGANFWAGAKQLGPVTEARIRDVVTGPDGPVAVHAEPLLNALHSVASEMVRPADQRVVIVFSGADIVAEPFVTSLRKRVTLSAPELEFPEATTLLLAQVTPEPGAGLRTLNQARIAASEVAYLPFTENLASQVLQQVRTILGANAERPLSQEDLAEVCAQAAVQAFPCVLPYAPTTESQLPRPPRRAAGAEWYSSIVWVVDDGLILKQQGPQTGGN